MATSYVFADTEHGRRLGISKLNPPHSGGTVIDTLEHEEGVSRDELLQLAADRNGPLRVETRRVGTQSWRHDTAYPATRDGLDEACMLAGDLTAAGVEARVTTSRGIVLKQWAASGGAPS
jgi:hypothetical protein